ncbi:hypothetical protein KEM54_001766 [Ascosphaera aggregata]|nr:hypothetical protein KEM54_001766 [Ascosphaera aggregata]
MLLMRLMSPIAYPTAVLLDKLVGKGHKTVYKKAGLKTLVTLHKTLGAAGEQLNSDEVTIISAVLDLKEKPVGSIMTPMENVFTMSVDSVLDEQAMDMILSQGYSRIPIHTPDNPENFIGMLLVKMLITYDPEDCKQVKDFALATLPETRPETSCLEIVNFFQEGKSHMVVVSESPGDDHGALGVVTLEDVIEELIGEEIIDESDVFVDVHKAIRRLTPAPKLLLPKGLFVPSVSSRSRFDNVNGENRLAPSAIPGPLQAAYMHSRGGHNNASNSPWSNKAGASGSAEDLLNERKFSEDDIREHLKRLGPSNPSNKPLQTRILNVKIKPGAVDGKSEIISPIDLSRPVSADQSAPSDADDQSPVETRTPLLRRKSGVGTVVSTYGTLDDDDIPRGSSRDDASTKSSNDTNFTTEIASADNNGADSLRPTRHASRHSSGSWSSDVTSPTGSNTPGPSRRATNSGSITEQVINVNGIQKVVLQIGHNGSCAESLSTSPITNSGRGNRGRRASGEGEETIAAPEDDSPQSPFAPLVSSDSEVLSASKEGGAGVGRGSRSFQTQRSSRP